MLGYVHWFFEVIAGKFDEIAKSGNTGGEKGATRSEPGDKLTHETLALLTRPLPTATNATPGNCDDSQWNAAL